MRLFGGVSAFGAVPAQVCAQSTDEDAAGASPDPDEVEANARALYEAGRIAYEEARFHVALQNFQSAYEMSERPELMFNVGLAQERLGDDAAALQSFEFYLENAPDGAERATVIRRVEVVRERIARSEDVEERSNTAGWAILASGAAVAVGAGVMLGVGVSKRRSVTGSTNGELEWTEAESRFDRGSGLMVTGVVALGVGAALSVLSIVLLRGSNGTEVSTNGTTVFVSGRL